jgi:hypothetical protein
VADGASSANSEVTMKPCTAIAVAFLALIAVVHLLRLFAGWEIVVVGFVVPVWWSAFGLVVAGGLALMVWREHMPVGHTPA